MNNIFKPWLMVGVIAMSLTMGGCSTLGGVGDAISSINPFDNDDSKDGEGAVAGENERISILSLNETLQVAETLSPSDISLPPVYVNPDWPQVGGNPNHVMQHTAASGSLKKIWSKNVGKGSSRKGRVTASPVIGGGQIFVMDGDNRISAYDQTSGKRNWAAKIKVESRGKTRRGRRGIIERIRDPLSFTDGSGVDKESVGGGVALADGKVFATSGLGIVTAFDAVTGEQIWTTPTRVPMHSAPTVADGRLFVVSDENELFAFNADTGDVLWTYQGIVESARMLTSPSPAVIGETVIAPFASGEIIAMRVQNGGVLWQDALSAPGRLTPLSTLNDIASGPAIADGYVIATAQSGVMSAFDLRTGQRIWTQPAGSLGFPLIGGDFVYTVTTDGQATALSKLDGSVIWITQLPAYKNEKKRKKRIAWSGPIFAGDRLFMASSRGRTVTMNPYDGTIIDEGKIGDSVFVSPIIAGETVYVLTDDAKIVALR